MSDERQRRTSGRPEAWDRSYADGSAREQWDIGTPQPAIVALADAGLIRSPVLDVGCGTGENALLLRSVTLAGGALHLLCFSDREPDWGGPYRISELRLRTAFADGWHVESVEPAAFATARAGGSVQAWLARMRAV